MYCCAEQYDLGQHMQIIGLCRFSYPAAGGFQVEHDSLEARQTYLYSKDRMEERFAQFEAMSLPGIAGQTDKDFGLAILIGSDLPNEYRTRLLNLVEPIPQIVIVEEEPGQNHRKVCQKVINKARDGHWDEFCIQFRHDDDDGLGVTFVERLRSAFSHIEGLFQDHRTVGIDFNRGYVARPDAAGLCAEEIMTPYYGVALAMAVRPGVRQTIMNFSHNKLAQFMPTLTFTHEPMYVRGHNAHNDSRQRAHVKPVDLPRLDALGEEVFHETFNINSDRVREIFASR